jgi:hypothetical protein
MDIDGLTDSLSGLTNEHGINTASRPFVSPSGAIRYETQIKGSLHPRAERKLTLTLDLGPGCSL